ncbi:MAG: restriction endonuclease [Armatimonadetes bacterium]|nr:restriction endonuclease [Armatimonadota bacterium]
MKTNEMEAMVKAVSLHPLLIIVSRALSISGFGDVQFLDRRESWQRSRYGGHELLCEATFGLVRMRVVVKVVRDSVRRRMLSELAGTVLYRKADMGILVATGKLSRRLAGFQTDYPPVRLEVIDGTHLSKLLLKNGIGTRGEHGVDYAFFGELETQSLRIISFLTRNEP